MADNQKPLLELSTLVPDRPFFTIDGKRYELAVLQDFGLVQLAQLQHLQDRIGTLQATTQPTSEEAEQLAATLDEAVTLLVRALPSEMRAKLTDRQKIEILQVFPGAVPPTGPPPNRQSRRRQRIGAKSSPGSNVSMEGSRTDGGA